VAAVLRLIAGQGPDKSIESDYYSVVVDQPAVSQGLLAFLNSREELPFVGNMRGQGRCSRFGHGPPTLQHKASPITCS